jgi:lysophospholipase L1-like esterase
LMTNAGYNLDFVGLQTGNPTNTLPDSNSEGHPGWLIANNQYSTSGYQQGLDSIMNGVFEQVEDPDAILLLIGVNDFGANYDTANAINRLNALVTKIATNRPASKIIVASLLPVANTYEEASISNSYNAYIPTLVSNQVAAGRQVYYIDLHSAITTNDLADGLHPNQLGYDKMATNWFGILTNQLTIYGTPNAPAIARVVGVGGLTNIVVVFNKPVRAGAATAANYSVSGGVSVLGATLDPVGMRKVTLTTTAQQPGSNYTLTVIGGVQDQTAAATAIAANSTATFQSSAARGATNNVPEVSGYQLVYSLNISNSANYLAGGGYNVDQRASVSNFTRVAYYVELQRSNAPLQYLWASMKTFTTNVNLIGVPTTANATTIQGLVTNLNVLSNARDIVNGTNLTGGTIQFWPWTYAASNSLDLLNASDSFFDWGNQPDTSSTYGCMELGNSAAAQMLFSFNNLTGSGNCSLGIANSPGPGFWQVDYDWTGMNNAADYTVKTLQVFVKPTNPNAPTLVSATAQPGRTNLVLTFSRPLQNSATNLANYSLSGGKTILQAQLDGTKQIVTLTTAQLLSGATYTITANNVYDLATSTVIDPDNNSIIFQAPQESDLSVAVYNVNFAGITTTPYAVTNGTTLVAPTTGGSELWNNYSVSAQWVNPSPVTLVAANEANPNPVTLTWGGGSTWTDGPTGWSGYNFSALTNTIWPAYMGDSGNAAVWFSGLDTNATYDVYVYFTWDRGSSSFTYNLAQGTAAVTNLTLNTSPAFVYNTQGKTYVSGTNYVVFSTVTPTASGVIMITNGNYSALQLVKRTSAPNAPTGLAATAASSSQINLSWNSVTNAFGYNVKRSTTNGGPYTVIATNLTGTNYSNTGLSAATTYYYVVSASNAAGQSTNSAQATATTLTGQTAPTLAAIANRITGVGVTLLITNVATDTDVPAQTLTFSLLTAPTNAVINTNSGVLTWRPLVAQANTTNAFTVQVTDSGTPPMSATQSFTVTVTNLIAPNVASVVLSQGMLVMQVNGASGPDYQVESSTNLVSWSPVFTTNSPNMPFTWNASTTNRINEFFRIRVGPPLP